MTQQTTQLPSILGWDLPTFKEVVSKAGFQPFIADQVFHWIYQKKVSSFDEMKNISKSNQQKLGELYQIPAFKLQDKIPSDEGAIKLIGQLSDGNSVECVVLKEKSYNTLCVSSQCGCPAGCTFCLTGYVGFKRQLTQAEIVGQVYLAESLGYPITNLVFMGMGEPMLNYDTLFSSIDWLNDPKGDRKSVV